jgi:hypothetical protein
MEKAVPEITSSCIQWRWASTQEAKMAQLERTILRGYPRDLKSVSYIWRMSF